MSIISQKQLTFLSSITRLVIEEHNESKPELLRLAYMYQSYYNCLLSDKKARQALQYLKENPMKKRIMTNESIAASMYLENYKEYINVFTPMLKEYFRTYKQEIKKNYLYVASLFIKNGDKKK